VVIARAMLVYRKNGSPGPTKPGGSLDTDMDRSYWLLLLADPSSGSLARLHGQCPDRKAVFGGVAVAASLAAQP
jgi:hypothetical protein